MKIVKFLAVSIFLASLLSCATHQLNLSGVQIESANTPKEIWQISDVKITSFGKAIYIYGKLYPTKWTGSAPQGHIDIAVYSHKGDLLFEHSTPWRRSTSFIRGRVRIGGQIRFNVKVNAPLTDMATIIVAFHHGERWPARQSDHQNKATL